VKEDLLDYEIEEGKPIMSVPREKGLN